MNLTQHPEYTTTYLHNQEAYEQCKNALAVWKTDRKEIMVESYSLRWTPESLRTFVIALSQMFQAYNQVLWEQFSYCPNCGGQCCVVDASDIRPFDLFAISLLDEKPPSLSSGVRGNIHSCIYLFGTQCTWPHSWRTIKCWSFYCLGSGPWNSAMSLEALFRDVTEQLVKTIRSQMPEALRRYEQKHNILLTDSLHDPVLFSDTLHQVLDALFVLPFHDQYPLFELSPSSNLESQLNQPRSPSNIFLFDDEDVMTFIAKTSEYLLTEEPVTPQGIAVTIEQFCEDLETLEWCVMGRPTNEKSLLSDMYQQYANAPFKHKGEDGSLWYEMRKQISKRLQNKR